MYTRVVVTLNKDERRALMMLADREQQYLQDFIRNVLRERLHRATHKHSQRAKASGTTSGDRNPT